MMAEDHFFNIVEGHKILSSHGLSFQSRGYIVIIQPTRPIRDLTLYRIRLSLPYYFLFSVSTIFASFQNFMSQPTPPHVQLLFACNMWLKPELSTLIIYIGNLRNSLQYLPPVCGKF